MKRMLTLLLAAAVLPGCAMDAPGTGWSRASDLSVYGAMHVYARAAADAEVLCAGFTPAATADRWRRDFGARHEAVTAALERRYGGEKLAQARATWAPSVECAELPDPGWRWRYARLLRLLETRLLQAREGES